MKSPKNLHRKRAFFGKYTPRTLQKVEIVLRSKKINRKTSVLLVSVPVSGELPKYNIEVGGIVEYSTYTLNNALKLYDSI